MSTLCDLSDSANGSATAAPDLSGIHVHVLCFNEPAPAHDLNAIHVPCVNEPATVPDLSIIHVPGVNEPATVPDLSIIHVPRVNEPATVPDLSSTHVPSANESATVPDLNAIHVPGVNEPATVPDLNAIHVPGVNEAVANSESLINDTSGLDDDPFESLLTCRRKHINNFLVSHLNINSFRYKFYNICDLLDKQGVDMLIISETKLDDTYVDAQFSVPGFSLIRKDRDCHGGGLLLYTRNDIPVRRHPSLEMTRVENITVEVTIGKTPWYIVAAYRPPKLSDATFTHECTALLDSVLMKSSNIILMGDLNYDLLLPNTKGRPLTHLCDIFDLTNIVKKPTCITRTNQSLLDVILTTSPRSVLTHGNIDTGLSDCHNMVYAVLKAHISRAKTTQITYRSYKHFNEFLFLEELKYVPLHLVDYIDDVNEAYACFSSLLTAVLDKHAPLKTKFTKNNCNAPFMNSELRKAIFKKRMLFNKFRKKRCPSTWDSYKAQRNLCTKLRKASINTYFAHKCAGGIQNSNFWPTIKPFLSNKGQGQNGHITLSTDGQLINDPEGVCDLLNSFFVNLGRPKNAQTAEVRPNSLGNGSIQAILANKNPEDEQFSFQAIAEVDVLKQIRKLDPHKSTGCDQIPAKIIKLSAHLIAKPISSIINKCIACNQFPDMLKLAEIVPIVNKRRVEMTNYRPINSILPCIYFQTV